MIQTIMFPEKGAEIIQMPETVQKPPNDERSSTVSTEFPFHLELSIHLFYSALLIVATVGLITCASSITGGIAVLATIAYENSLSIGITRAAIMFSFGFFGLWVLCFMILFLIVCVMSHYEAEARKRKQQQQQQQAQ